MHNTDKSPWIPEKGRSFAQLMTANHIKVRRYIGSLGVDFSSVDDIAQEAFLIAYQNFDSFEYKASFSTWVSSIARNLISNERRKTNRRHQILHEKITDILIELNLSNDTIEYDDDNTRLTALASCMKKLPDQDRDLVNMRYQHGIEPAGIANNLDLKPTTVRQRLLRVRQALRDCISQHMGKSNFPM
jgi:RNA polymerase sigma-70 factor, ECF subfamily